ncbi:MAG: hypothetical protein ACI9X4_001277 [Glaciecola sp.]|jgi:hypothetical protein
MGNLFRTLLLLITVLAGAVLYSFHYQSNLIERIDGRLQRQVAAPYQKEFEAIQALELPDEIPVAVERLENALDELDDVQVKDKLFTVWRSMTGLLSQHYQALGEDPSTIELLRAGLDRDPRNLEFRSELATVLIRVGTPETLLEAREHLQFFQTRFPFRTLEGVLRLQLAVKLKDGKAIADAMASVQVRGRAALMTRWQAFLFSPTKNVENSTYVSAVADSSGDLVRLEITLDVPEGGVSRFRLDPPGDVAGYLFDWGVCLRDVEGNEIFSESKKWTGMIRSQLLDDGSVELSGKRDPQLVLRFGETFAFTGPATVECWFRPEPRIPAGVAAALQDPGVRAEYEQQRAILIQGGSN